MDYLEALAKTLDHGHVMHPTITATINGHYNHCSCRSHDQQRLPAMMPEKWFNGCNVS